MKNHIIKLILAFFLISFSSTILAQTDTSELKALIKETNDQFIKAMMAKDNNTLLSLYTDDIISLPSYSPMIKGKNTLAEMLKKDASNPNKMTEFSLSTTDVIPAANNLIIEIGKYELTMELVGMDKPWKDNGKYLTVFEKQDDGSLKIKIDIWNSDLNPWQMMKKDMNKKHNGMMKKDSDGH